MIYHVGKKISWCFLCFRPTLKIKDHIVYPVLWLNEVGIVEKSLTKPTENHSFNSLYSKTNMEWLYCYDPFYVTCMTFTLFKMHVYILVNKRSDTKIFLKYIFMLKPKQLFIIIYINVCVKRVYLHKTNNSILFRYGKIVESQFSVLWSN
jgi:hypothetical protein